MWTLNPENLTSCASTSASSSGEGGEVQRGWRWLERCRRPCLVANRATLPQLREHFKTLIGIFIGGMSDAAQPVRVASVRGVGALLQVPAGREFFIDNLLVRMHFIIVMIRWTGLAPWEFEFPWPVRVASVRGVGALLKVLLFFITLEPRVE